MEEEISQFVAEQREGVERHKDREHHRDRERRRDRRRRERERRDRGGRDGDRGERGDHSRGWERERSRERYDNRCQEDLPQFDNYREHDNHSRVHQNFNNMYEKPQPIYENGLVDLEGESSRSSSYGEENYGGRDRRLSRDSREFVQEEKGGEKWMTDTPSNTILLKGLPRHIDEKDIKAELMMFGAPVKDVRLMRRKDTGVSRGFAFVEFQNVGDSQRWMEQNQGQVTMLNQFLVNMYYSSPRTGAVEGRMLERLDWTCSKCGVFNFRRRDYCFKCSIPREESEKVKECDGYDQVGNNPCNTLIFRGLDALTTEENLLASLTKISALPVKNVRVMRDELTGTSKGYGFVEMSSIQESTQLLDTVHKLQQPFEVDGKAIIVSYAKNTYSTVMATVNQQPTGQWDPSVYNAGFDQNSYYSQAGYFEQPAQPQADEFSSYYQQYAEEQPITVDPKASTQSDSTNAAAAVAQAAIQQAQAAKHYQKQHQDMQKQILTQMQKQQKLALMTPEERLSHQAAEWSHHQQPTPEPQPEVAQKQPAADPNVKYPVPDVSTYQYDETSGYYYDPSTGLYYDANSQYYYNGQTGQFLYWDGEKHSYLPAPADTASQLAEAQQVAPQQPPPEQQKPNEPVEKVEKEKDKKEKVKVAKKIAKDMEKWAKTLNAQKDASKYKFFPGPFSPQPAAIAIEKESAAADAGFAILEKKSVADRQETEPPKKSTDTKLMPPPPPLMGQSPGLVAPYGGDSESDDDEDRSNGQSDDDKLTDWSKMACLLCKRQFSSKETLQRHQQYSDLHKKNLEAYTPLSPGDSEDSQIQYRDRAKERREKYGVPEPPLPKKRKTPKAPVPYEQPTKAGIGSDNIGSKLLQKMGWSQGQGLGKANQGRTKIVEAKQRTAQAGLGARGSSYNREPGETYKDCVKKTMFARYHEVD